MNKRALAYAVLGAVILMPIVAHAQLVGAMPDAAMTAFANWLQGPIGRPLITVAFIIAGITMMIGRHTFEGIVFCILGASFFAGASGLANLLTGTAG